MHLFANELNIIFLLEVMQANEQECILLVSMRSFLTAWKTIFHYISNERKPGVGKCSEVYLYIYSLLMDSQQVDKLEMNIQTKPTHHGIKHQICPRNYNKFLSRSFVSRQYAHTKS